MDVAVHDCLPRVLTSIYSDVEALEGLFSTQNLLPHLIQKDIDRAGPKTANATP
jgi:hypothetical protein